MYFPFPLSSSMLWIGLLIIFLIAEAATVGFISIWFCFGSLCAFAAAKANTPFYVQIIVFFVTSVASIILTRPFVRNVLKLKNNPTNFDRILNQSVIVTERIDNRMDTGAIKHDGKIWTARSTKDDIIFEKGSFVTVDRVEGVKVIVK